MVHSRVHSSEYADAGRPDLEKPSSRLALITHSPTTVFKKPRQQASSSMVRDGGNIYRRKHMDRHSAAACNFARHDRERRSYIFATWSGVRKKKKSWHRFHHSIQDVVPTITQCRPGFFAEHNFLPGNSMERL